MKNIIQYITLGCLVFCFQQNAVAQINPSDGCAAPNTLPVNATCVNNSYTLAGSFANGGITNASCAAGNDKDDGWYQFIATSTTTYISADGDRARVLAVFTACPTGISTELACDAQAAGTTASVTVPTTIGNTYFVQLHRRSGNNNADMIGTICISSGAVGGSGDDCAGAIPITHETLGNCTAVNGDVNTATNSGVASACFGTEDDDIWYSFVATNTTAVIQRNANFDSEVELFDGCGGTSLDCQDAESDFIVSGLTIGNTYIVRIYGYFSAPQTDGTYDLCVTSPTPPPANDDCIGAVSVTVNPDQACGSVTPGTVASATASSQDATACFGTEDDDVWFSFVATDTRHSIDLLNVAGSVTDMYHSVWEGSCPALSLVANSCSDPNSSTVIGLTIGNTYYIRVYSYTSTSGQNSTFDVCVGTLPPPPVNATCSGILCTDGTLSISGATNGVDADVADPGNDYGCLSSSPNPYWYYLEVDAAGNIDMSLTAGSDIDFAIWGPFANVAAAQAACGSYGVPIDCNFGSTSTETPSIIGASVGEVYVMLITNFADINQTITLSQSGGAGSAACTIIPCNANAGGW